MATKEPGLTPVIYLAFSNNQDAYLPKLKEEERDLSNILSPLHENGSYEVFSEEKVDLNDLFARFKRFRRRLWVFHYGGHAEAGNLLLEGEKVQGKGLAALFGTLETDVKLVFLNGCSTLDQVDGLLSGENNVSAVIGTSVPIDDDSAIDFSRQFYSELVSGSTLKASFDVASAYLLAKYEQKQRPQVAYRALTLDPSLTREIEIPWGLYISEGRKEMLEWKLVEHESSREIDYGSLKSVSFEGTATEKSVGPYSINQYLVKPIMEAILRWDPEVEANPNKEELYLILESGALPLPVGLEVSPLINGASQFLEIGMERLGQLILAYQETTKFLAYSFLAQLTNKISEGKVHLSTSNVLLTRFLGLSPSQSQTFDFLKLANDIDGIFRDHEIEPWLKELVDTLKAFDGKEELVRVHNFMRELVPLVLPETPKPTESLDLLCERAEYCLGKLLEEASFLIRYQLVAIRMDEASSTLEGSIIKDYNTFAPISGLDPSFSSSVWLMRNNPGVAVSERGGLRLTAENLAESLDLSYYFKNNSNVSIQTQAPDLMVFEFKYGEELHFRSPGGGSIVVNPDEEGYVNFLELLEIDEVRQSPKLFRYANYNSDAPDGEDHLDVMPDVRAFANLIASSDLRPPLSIGLFGDWGSGKSFFMGKLKKEVEQYEKRAKRELAKSADAFQKELEGISDPEERLQKVLSLFPAPETQITQIQEWIQRWEKRRDPSALRSLGRVYGLEPSGVEKKLLSGDLDEFTTEASLISNLTKSQQKEAESLSNDVQKVEPAAITLLRKLVELNSEEDLGYCRNIAQIEFNAWHYIDTNLWASLVTNILEDLNTYVGNLPQEEKAEIQLFRDLATTQVMKEQVVEEITDINEEIKTIEKNLEKLETEKKNAEKELKGVRFQDAISLLSAEDENVKGLIDQIKKQGNEAYEKIGLKGFEVNVQNAQTQVKDLEADVKATWGRSAAWLQTYKELTPMGKFFIIFLIVVPLLAFWVLPELNIHLPVISDFVDWISGFTNPVFAGLIPLFTLFGDGVALGRKLLKKINKAGDAVDLAKLQLGKLQAMASEEHQKEIAAKEEELIEKKTEWEDAQQRKTKYEKRVKELEEDIAEIEAGKRLSKFIENRVLSNDYQQHLGLISLIREDFEQLTSYLHSRGFYSKVVARIQNVVAGTNKETKDDPYKLEKVNTIDRIVLYVDDLDRCPPDKVVQVLQAIHLILAFPLFVVVVGVDVRWISRSLIKEYGTMLAQPDRKPQALVVSDAKGESEKSLHFQGNATPFDYLEKIFQLPFQLQTMSESSKEFFIGKLLESDMKQAKAVSPTPLKKQLSDSTGTHGQHEMEKKNEGQAPSKEIKSAMVSEAEGESSGKIEKNIEIENKESGKQALRQAVIRQQRLEKVSLKVREINFIKSMSPILADSPRTVKRFVNVCRLIKSHAIWGKSQRVLEGKITDYETMIFILALVTGIPVFTRFLFDYLEEEKSEISFNDLVTKVNRELEKVKTNGQDILAKKNYLDRDELLEEWESFHKVWRLNEPRHHGPLHSEDINHNLVKDFCDKNIHEIKPLFKTAVRFSFRFTEY